MKKQIQISKIKKLLFVLNIIQIIVILILIINRVLLFFHMFDNNLLYAPDFLLGLSLILIIYNTYFSMRDLHQFRFWEEQIQMQKEALENMENLNLTLRSQRHDFLNHIQILYSLVELKEYDEVAAYLHKLYGDIEKLSRHIKTDHVAINALLQAKSNDAKKRSIQYNVSIQSKLSGLPVPSWEMCRCLGNLMDNGIQATEKYTGEKKLEVIIRETISEFIFEVNNTGNPIPNNWQNKIFESGFTTKEEEGHGVGLYIVKKITKEYNGTVEVESKNDITCFRIRIPK